MKLLGIATRSQKNGPMHTSEHTCITLDAGLEEDFRRPPSDRQVTVLSMVQWQQACNELDVELPWTARRANLLVDKIEFSEKMLGKFIVIDDLILEIRGETDPCKKMDQFHQGLKQALTPNWRGGVCCKVLHGGSIQVGDKVELRSQR